MQREDQTDHGNGPGTNSRESAVNHLSKSVVRESRTPRSVGTGSGRPLPVTRWCWKSTAASGNSLALYSTSRPVLRERGGAIPLRYSPSRSLAGGAADHTGRSGALLGSCYRDV